MYSQYIAIIREQDQMRMKEKGIIRAQGENTMKKRMSTFLAWTTLLLAGVMGLLVPNALFAQRMPAATTGPSVTWKAPLRGPAGDYVGAQRCAGCHRDEAREFFKTPHAQYGEAPKVVPASAGAAESPSVAAGRKLYNDMMCSACHQIGGQGGTFAPAMDDVGARLTREQLMDRMLKRRAGTIMPTLPADTPNSQIDQLVDYMVSLKGQAPAETKAAAIPTTVTGCEACHGPGKAHADAEQVAAGDFDKEMAASKLIFKFDGNPKENSERCLACHDSGKGQSSFDHSEHLSAGVACQDCHATHLLEAAKNPNKVAMASAQSALFSVPSLPEENRWLHNNLLKESQPQLCFQCHETVRAQFALPEHHRVPEGFMKCTDCHNPHGNMNHFQLTKAAWETCVTCHVEKRGPWVYEHAVVRVEGCGTCHTPHGSINNFLLKRREQRMLCLQCHSVIHKTAPISGLNGQANVPHGRGGYQTSGDCTRCHVAVHGSNLDEFLLR